MKSKIEKNNENQVSTTKKIDEYWSNFKESLQEATKNILPKRKMNKTKPWITEEILKLMEERKTLKNKPGYKILNKKIRMECRKAKELWLNKKCEDIEELQKKHKYRDMYEKVRELSGAAKSRAISNCIKSTDDKTLFDKDEILKRWTEYSRDLFKEDRREKPLIDNLEGPSILPCEVEMAIRKLKSGKATGCDDISAEMLKSLIENQEGIKIITNLCNLIYDAGYLPKDLKHSIFIPIPKKNKSLKCDEHRIISIISQVTKILLKIVMERNKRKINVEINDTQSGFQENKGTREGIFNLRTIIERTLERQKSVYLCFIDYSKAFDTVQHKLMINCLSRLGIDGKDIRLLINLYWEQTAAIRIDGEISEDLLIEKGVRQGCVLSPLLFNLYTEGIFKEIEDMKGITIGGININNLRYADDTVLLAENETDLQRLLETTKNLSEKYGLKFNIKKTKVMVIPCENNMPKVNISIEGKMLEQVQNYVYLGHMITEDGKMNSEIKRRMAIARTTFLSMRNILTSKEISLKTRIRLTKCYVWSTLHYGAETWTISKDIENKLRAFEMWMLRRILRISWKDKKSNLEVLEMAGVKRSLIETIKRRKMIYFGHILRHDCLQKTMLEGMVEGKRKIGRPRTTWSKNARDWTNLNYEECAREAQSRTWWRHMVVNLLEGEDT
jgi:hypothetical protein